MPDSPRSGGTPALTPETPDVAFTALAALSGGPYNDTDVNDVANLAADAAVYLGTAVQEGGVTAASTIAIATAFLAITAGQMPALLAWAGDWLSAEITAGRVTGGRPLPGLAAAARGTLEAAAWRAADLACALESARDLTAALRRADEPPGPMSSSAGRAAPARHPKRLSPRRQLYEDLMLAVGPGLAADVILRAFQDARIIDGSWNAWPLAWIAVLLAVFLFHRVAAPQPPPPASTARRVLTWAAAAVTAAVTAACVAATCVLIARGALAWWYLLDPVIAIAPLQAASQAIHRNRRAPCRQ
jgi:hypothetical protein